jgi:hypothetical protein
MIKPAPDRRRKRLWGCLALLVFAGVVLLIGLVGFLLLRSREGRWVGPAVSIRQPLRGARLSLEHGGVVVMEAMGSEPIRRYELWVDGAPQGVLRPAEGKPSLTGEEQIRWVPDGVGTHVLIAIAYDRRGMQGRSKPVVVDVTSRDAGAFVGVRVEVQAGDTPASLSERSGLSPEQLEDVLPSDLPVGEMTLPVPWSSLPPGFFGEGGPEPASPGDEPPAPEWDLPPEVPQPVAGLAAEPAGGCQVRLTWQLADPVSGLRLYRYGGMADDFTSVAEIEPQAAESTDTVRWGGSYLYVLATVGRRGETPGPMARVEVPAETCPDEEPLPESGLAWLQFEGMRVVTQETFDRLYCYFSLDGEEYQRIPGGKDSSLTLTEDGWDLTPYLAGIHRRVFEHDVQTPVSLRLECWGWRGDDLLPLGELDDLRPRQDWTQDLMTSSPGFRFLFGILGYQNDLPVLDQLLIEADEPPPPPWHLSLGLDTLDCLAHVNQGGGEDLYGGEGVLSQWACFEIPETMLVWDWPSEEGWELSDIDGYRVEVIRDWDNWDPDEPWEGELHTEGESGSANMAFPVSTLPSCLRTFGFRVEAYRDTEERRLYSEPSPVLLVSNPDCPDAAVVEIELVDIEVRELDDGCILFCDGESLQAYGSGEFVVIRSPWYTVANPDSDSFITHEARVDFWTDECDAGLGEGCLIQPRTVHNGTINLAEEDLRVCQDGGCTEFGPGNNRVRLVLYQGDQITFPFMLWDVDGVEDDVWCGTTEDIGVQDRLSVYDYTSVSWIIGEIFGEQTLREWAEGGFEDVFYNYAFDALKDQDAKCTVHVRVRGLGLYRGG